MFGKRRDVAGPPESFDRRHSIGAVVAVLAGDVEEGRGYDIRPAYPDGPHEPLDGALPPPLIEGLLG